MRKFLFFLLILVGFNSCNELTELTEQKGNYVALSDAVVGKKLDRAYEVSLDSFFEKMMSNDIITEEQRETARFYQIIYNSKKDIYFGIIERDKFNREIVQPFYKVNYEEVVQYFPGYEEIDGADIKQLLYDKYFFDMIEQEVKPHCFNSFNISYPVFKIIITDEGIDCDVECLATCYESKLMAKKVKCILDPSTLDVISESVKDVKY